MIEPAHEVPVLPGNAVVPDKPNIRLIDGMVVRYVWPWYCDEYIDRLGVLDVQEADMPDVLEEFKEDFEGELTKLRTFGVPLPDVTIVEVADIPRFDPVTRKSLGNMQKGLTITTPFIRGFSLMSDMRSNLTVMPQCAEPVRAAFTGMQKYLDFCVEEGEPFMRDIFDLRQCIYEEETSQVTMLDLDPAWADPNEHNSVVALSYAYIDSVLEEVTNAAHLTR